MAYYGYIRERKLPPEPSAKPQITSFADVTLALLVIFLVTASAAVKLIELSLPKAANTASRDMNLAVTVSARDCGLEVAEGPDKVEAEEANFIRLVAPAPGAEAEGVRPAMKDTGVAVRFLRREGEWFIEDVGSSGGVVVDGQRISEATKLSPGDEIRCGASRLVYHGVEFFFEDDSTPIEGKNLWAALRDIKGGMQWERAVVRADREVPCEHVTVLVTCLQGLGVDEMCFMMAEEEGA